jgi:hypothetical protein
MPAEISVGNCLVCGVEGDLPVVHFSPNFQAGIICCNVKEL